MKGFLLKFILPLLGIATISAGALYFAAPDKFQQLIPIGITPIRIFSNLKAPSSANFSYEPPILKNIITVSGTGLTDPAKFSKIKIDLNLANLPQSANSDKLPLNIKHISVEIIANSQTAYIKLFVAQRNQLQATIQKSTQIPPAMLTTYLEPAISVLSGEKYLKIDKQDIQKYSKQKFSYTQSMLTPQTYMEFLKLVYKSLDVSKPEKLSLDGQETYKLQIHIVKDKLLAALQQAKNNTKLLKELKLTQTDLDQIINTIQNTDPEDIESLYLDVYFKQDGKDFYIAAISPSLKLNEDQKTSINKTLAKIKDDSSNEAKELKNYLTKALNSGFLNLGVIKYTNINKVTETITPPNPSQTVSFEQFMSSVFYFIMMNNTNKYKSNTPYSPTTPGTFTRPTTPLPIK